MQLDSAFGYYNNALLNGLTSVIGNAQYSQRLQDMVKQMLSEHNTTIEHPNSMHQVISVRWAALANAETAIYVNN